LDTAMTAARSVEDLCDQLRSAAADGGDVDLWVPGDLSLGGNPVPAQPSGLVMAIVTDLALSLGLWPSGSTDGDGGRMYHYRRRAG
jgi:hypothetical protein